MSQAGRYNAATGSGVDPMSLPTIGATKHMAINVKAPAMSKHPPPYSADLSVALQKSHSIDGYSHIYFDLQQPCGRGPFWARACHFIRHPTKIRRVG